LTGDNLFNGGIPIAPDKGKISIILSKPFQERQEPEKPSSLWRLPLKADGITVKFLLRARLFLNLEKGERSELSDLAIQLL
jgi:hypothetical protein